MFDPAYDPTRYKSANVFMFLKGDFLRLSSWSGGLAHSESAMQDVNIFVCQIRVLVCCFERKKFVLLHLVFFPEK